MASHIMWPKACLSLKMAQILPGTGMCLNCGAMFNLTGKSVHLLLMIDFYHWAGYWDCLLMLLLFLPQIMSL